MGMMKNIKLFSWIFSAIWLRHPVIIQSPNIKQTETIFNEISPFIPRYRYPIICGNVSPGILLNYIRPLYLGRESLPTITQTILSSFEEEKNLECKPLQLLSFDSDSTCFLSILRELQKGWIATTTLSTGEIQDFFPDETMEIQAFDENSAIIFLKGRPRNVSLELELLDGYISRNHHAGSYFIQKKFAEIHYAAEAVVKEIEEGKTFRQEEIREYYQLDAKSFEKCMQIIESEFNTIVQRYVTRTAPKIKKILNKTRNLEGILYACSLTNGELTGLMKTRESIKVPIDFYQDLFPFVQHLTQSHEVGKPKQIIIEYCRKTKLLIMFLQSSTQSENAFAFFLKQDILLPPFIREITNIINSEIN